jgi:hypothetical protein
METLKKSAKEILNEFKQHDFRIVRAKQTKNPKKRLQYMRAAIESYNGYISEINKYFQHIGFDDKSTIRKHFIEFKDKIITYIGAYNLKNFPKPTDGYHIIDITDQLLEASIVAGLAGNEDPLSDDPLSDDPLSEPNSRPNSRPNSPPIMATPAVTKIDFINLCSRHIANNYDGGFETLRSFLNKINFLNEIAGTDATLQSVLLSYLLTKLDQKALSKLPETPASINEIVNCLKSKIKHDSSKVIEGQMTALTLDNKPLVEFQTKAKALADNYQQALIEEGIPLSVAEKMAIDKTVDLCRKNTKSSEVKAVISATAHPDVASVIAKMVTQIDAVRQDRISSGNGNKNNKDKDTSRGGHRGKGRGNSNNSRNGNGENNSQNRNNSNNNNNNNNSRGGNNNNRRGRGRGNNNGNGYGNNRDGQNNGQFYQQYGHALPVQGNGQMPHQGAQPYQQPQQ